MIIDISRSKKESTFMIEYTDKIYSPKKKVPKDMSPRFCFKQFFTPQKYSRVMIDSLEINSPRTIIDLAIGGGALLSEAVKRWESSIYYGNDIDKRCSRNIHDNHTHIKKCFTSDVFKEKSISSIIKEIGKVDLCLGNPPFHLIKQNKDIKNILIKYELDKQYNSDNIPAEVIFILQCLEILCDNGTLALILPDGFFVNSHLKYFREFLIENYHIQKVVDLPNNIFEKTDAKTHILILKKAKFFNCNITLIKNNNNSIQITKEEAVNRMDFDFYNIANQYKKYKTISSLNVQFSRGKSKYLIDGIKSHHILHTTNFSKGKIFSNNLITTNKLAKYKNQIAQPGDIIFARVGSNCLGKVGLVKKGYFVATDCIFVIRIKDTKLRKFIYDSLISDEGKKWIQANSKGVAAKHITLEDIKRFPIIN